MTTQWPRNGYVVATQWPHDGHAISTQRPRDHARDGHAQSPCDGRYLLCSNGAVDSTTGGDNVKNTMNTPPGQTYVAITEVLI